MTMLLQKVVIEPFKKLSRKLRRGREKLTKKADHIKDTQGTSDASRLIFNHATHSPTTREEFSFRQMRRPNVPPRKSSLAPRVIARTTRNHISPQPVLTILDKPSEAIAKYDAYTEPPRKVETIPQYLLVGKNALSSETTTPSPKFKIQANGGRSNQTKSLQINKAVKLLYDHTLDEFTVINKAFLPVSLLNLLSLRLVLDFERNCSLTIVADATIDGYNRKLHPMVERSAAQPVSLSKGTLTQDHIGNDNAHPLLDEQHNTPSSLPSQYSRRSRSKLGVLGSYRFQGMLAVREASLAIQQLLQQKETGIQYWNQMTNAYDQLRSVAADQTLQLQENNNSLQCQIYHLENEMDNLKHDNMRLLASDRGIQQHMQLLSQEVHALNLNLKNSQDREARYQAHINALATQVTALTTERDALEKERSFAEWNAAKWQKSCNSAEEELEDAEKEIDALERQLEVRRLREEEEESTLRDVREELVYTERQRDFYKARLDVVSSHKTNELLIARETSKELREQNELLKQEHVIQKQLIHNLLQDHHERYIKLAGQEKESSVVAAPNKLLDAERCIEDLQHRVKAETDGKTALFDAASDLRHELEVAQANIQLLSAQNENLAVCVTRRGDDAGEGASRLSICQHQAWLLAKTKKLYELKQQFDSQATKHRFEMAQKEEEVHESCGMLMQEQARTHVLREGIKDRDAEIADLKMHRDELVNQLSFKAYGEHKEVMDRQQAAIFGQYEQHLQTYSWLLNERDTKISRMEDELSNGEIIVERREELISGLRINCARSEATMKAMEDRFAVQLRSEPLIIDLRPCLKEFSYDQMAIMRQIDSKLYRLVDMDINEEKCPDWMM